VLAWTGFAIQAVREIKPTPHKKIHVMLLPKSKNHQKRNRQPLLIKHTEVAGGKWTVTRNKVKQGGLAAKKPLVVALGLP
jgi:hypothetical protein